VKLLAPQEDGADLAHEIAAGATKVITSRISLVEARSALARAHRNTRISADQLGAALDLLDRLWEDTLVVELDESVAAIAGQLVLDRALRSLAGIQLASALVANASESVAFACWDSKLRTAAGAEGLELVPGLTSER
jgi:predicted nucleic acid-binding protein